MHQESKQFGVKVTNSFKRNFNQSILKLSFLYGTILVTILAISGFVTFNEFSGRIGRRFKDVPPTITIQLPNGDLISNKPLAGGGSQLLISTSGVQFFATQTPQTIQPTDTAKINGQPVQLAERPVRNRLVPPTAEEIREDLIASLIFVNGILLLLASIASYWLARLTLRPIHDSYERQRRFLGDASHELRTPLSILQIELENEMHGAGEKELEQLSSKLDEVKRMGKIVGDLLTISRLDEGGQLKKSSGKHLDAGAFAQSVETITSRLGSLAESRNVHIKFHNVTPPHTTERKEKNTPTISIDEDLFSHALTNLIKNAIFYNKKDGTVDVTVRTDHKKFIVEIKDSGIGISKPDLERIFERFYRADKSRTRKNTSDEGSGLGLSIAQSALLSMGGNLNIQSELNIGTTVYVELHV